jgi:hypothetical protein
MAKRRVRGEGSIIYVEERKRFRARIYRTDKSGARKPIDRWFEKQRDASNWLQEQRHQDQELRPATNERETVGQYLTA